MSECFETVAAVVVTYNPERSSLNSLLRVLGKQVERIVVVDNSSENKLDLESSFSGSVINLRENVGIAEAQNIGIRSLTNTSIKDVVLFDQDSLPSKTMVRDLIGARTLAQLSGLRVAAVGPVHIDSDSGHDSLFVKATEKKLSKIVPSTELSKGVEFETCSFLIASGCLISLETLNAIGLMESELFIDCVDIEWGFRAQSLGWSCIAAFNAKMYHKIGDQPLVVLGKHLTTHTPLRHYYFYRNFYLLLKRSYIPKSWKVYTFFKSISQAIVFCTLLSPRLEHFSYIACGIKHGLMNRSGKYEN